MFPTKTADGSNTLFSEYYKQTFHSDKGALSESRHVFLEGSGVAEALRKGLPTSVLEVGLGTGLNFFLTADLALKYEANLQYYSLEQSLLAAETVAALEYQMFLQDSSLLTAYGHFREGLPKEPASGRYCFYFKSVSLTILLGEASAQRIPETSFDAIYQDAFSPDANPELWTSDFFERLYKALRSEGVLTSYSVKGDVRRRLQNLGFQVEKRPGPPGGKREMLFALKKKLL